MRRAAGGVVAPCRFSLVHFRRYVMSDAMLLRGDVVFPDGSATFFRTEKNKPIEWIVAAKFPTSEDEGQWRMVGFALDEKGAKEDAKHWAEGAAIKVSLVNED